jgi:sialic acid synthase
MTPTATLLPKWVIITKAQSKLARTEEFYNSPYNSENAFGATYGEHREALEFDFRQYELLKAYAESIGLTFFATAFDIPSADFLAALKVPAIKIASGDATNIRLLEHVWKWKTPLIISTGGLNDGDDILRLIGPSTAVLHCTSGYPAKYEELNLRCISMLRDYPQTVIGWSAHDTGIAMAPVAYALGARIIEKHFTLDRSMKGTDQAMSLEPGAMKKMIENLKLCRLALGDGIKRQYPSEIDSLKKQRKNADGRIDGRTVS